MVRVAAAGWAAVALLFLVPMALSLLHIIPLWWRWVPSGVFFILLGPAIRWVNQRQGELRQKPGP